MKILIGGSPCTYWSIAQTKNRETKPEGLGWELFNNYLIALEKFKPDFFLYENNKSINHVIREQITRELGVEPIPINSALVSAQNRQRLYWSNIPGVDQPEDRGIVLQDILDDSLLLSEKGGTGKTATRLYAGPISIDDYDFVPGETTGVGNVDFLGGFTKKDGTKWLEDGKAFSRNFNQGKRLHGVKGKSVTVTAQGAGLAGHAGLYAVPLSAEIPDCEGESYPRYEVKDGQISIKDRQHPIKLSDGLYVIRRLAVDECKRLQTVPDDYIFPVSNAQAYKMLGNGWTCDVISHILSCCPGIIFDPLTVLSMYDGMSCGRIALNKLNAHIDRYYATEIDKYAIQTSQTNFPDIIHLGDAFQVREESWKLPG